MVRNDTPSFSFFIKKTHESTPNKCYSKNNNGINLEETISKMESLKYLINRGVKLKK
ncbi:MAG: hypothetical protein Pg6B_00980 [Candidatus Azobacteroides pseudotrichonymphae]|nr:MAG: hypothetical protein Pg6B_00980 [Candidatus Azobacteroides pseudotrichonymphae]